jgi:type II secretion system protein N
MNSRGGSFFRWFWYCCYAVVLTAILLYLRFPVVKFNEFCVRQAEGLVSGSRCTIGNIAYDFPFGISLKDVSFFLPKQEKSSVFVVNSLAFSPVFKDFGNNFAVSGRSYSGQFSGTLHIKQKDRQFSLDPLVLQNLNLGEMKAVQDMLGRELSGRLDFTGRYSAAVNQYLAGNATGKVKLREGKISLLQPVLALKEIDLQQVELEIQYDKHELQCTKGKMKGKDVSSDFSGMVKVNFPWYLSSVAAKGEMALTAGFMKGNKEAENEIAAVRKQFKKSTLPFEVNGSLQKPAFRFGH